MRTIIISGVSRGLGKELFTCLTGMPDVLLIGISRPSDSEIINTNENQLIFYIDLAQDNIIFPDPSLWIRPTTTQLIWINNAGTIDPIGKIGNLDVNEVDHALHTNLISPIKITSILVHATLKYKLPFKVINISSGAALSPIPGWGVYCTGKCGISMFLDCLAKDHPNVELTHIDPGVLDTEMQKKIRESDEKDFPLVSNFIAYHNDRQLKDPKAVANDIVATHILR